MKKTILYIFALFISTSLMGQSSKMPISIGYFVPYGLHPGLKVSTTLEFQKWENDKTATLSVSPQLGYFIQQSYANVSHNMTLDASLDYRRYAENQQFYGLVAAGIGYHANFQRVDAIVNVGSGDINYNTSTNHFFVPTFTLGFGKDKEEGIGYYFKAFTGQRINTSVGSELMVGAELGLTFYL